MIRPFCGIHPQIHSIAFIADATQDFKLVIVPEKGTRL